MNSARIKAVVLRQLFLLRHNWTRFSNIFIWIFLDILLWGFISKYLDVVGNTGFSFISVFLGAILLWDLLIRFQQGVMLAFLEDVWSQNFMNYFASPLTIREYVAGLVLTSILTSVAGLAVMLLVSAAFGLSIFNLGLLLISFVGILFLFGIALGIFACALVLRFGPSAEWLAWPIPFILAPFAGIFYPVSTLPAVFQYLAKIIPPSYVFEGMRNVLLNQLFSWPDIITGLLIAFVFLVLAYLFFVRIYRIVLKTGILTRFGAEYIP